MSRNTDNTSPNDAEVDLSEVDVLRLENLSLLKRWLQSETERVALLERQIHVDLSSRYGIAGSFSVNLNRRKLIPRAGGSHE